MAGLPPTEHAPAPADACNWCHQIEHLSTLVEVAGRIVEVLRRIVVIVTTVVLTGIACVSLLKGHKELVVPISVLLATVNGVSALSAIDHVKRKDRAG